MKRAEYALQSGGNNCADYAGLGRVTAAEIIGTLGWHMKCPMRSTIAGSILLVAICLEIAAQPGHEAVDESARILSLENAWNQAEVRHDARALSLLLAETFEFTDDDGHFMDKSQWLAHIKDGVDHYEQLGNSGMAVHFYGDVAIGTGKYKDKMKEKGKGVVRSGRFTECWIRQNAASKCVGCRATSLTH